jgi:putative ABC transport system permease protein
MNAQLPEPTFADRAYRFVLGLYPPSFRNRFGDEMMEFFRTRRLAASGGGALARLGFWARTIADVAPSVWRERRRDSYLLRPGLLFAGVGGNVRDAVRFLRRSPGVSLAIVLLMTLTIGAATTIFSVVNAVLLKPLPFNDPNRLVIVWEARPERGVERGVVSGHEFPVWYEQNRVFDKMAAIAYTGSVTLTGAGEPKSVSGARVTSDFFNVMGVRPLLGRGFVAQEDEPGRGGVVVLSERLWRERFNADAAVTGRKIMLDDRPFEVVGVMAESFSFPPMPLGAHADYWAPIAEPIRLYRGRHYLMVVARLKPDVSIGQAREDMDRVARDLRKQFPELNYGHETRVQPLQGDLVRESRASLMLLLGAVSCLLLIGCSNVAGLLLARGLTRHQEIGVRLAIGGTRLDIARQLMAESLLLAICGAALGVAATFWIAGTIPSLVPRNVLALDHVTVDTNVLLFALTMSVATGMLFGIAPALQIRHVNLGSVLQRSGRSIMTAGSPRIRRLVVAGQVALTLVLVLAAGLMGRGLLALQAIELGYTTSGLLAAEVSLPGARYPRAVQQRQFFIDLMERAAAIPGVTSVSATSAVPLGGRFSGVGVDVEGRPTSGPEQERLARYRIVSSDYFKTMAIPVLSGREFAPSDARIAVPIIRWFPQQPQPAGIDQPQPIPVAVINAAMARQCWPDSDPVGRRFRIMLSPWITVVGVVANTHNDSLRDPARPEFYLHDLQEPQANLTVLIRSAGDPVDLAPLVRSTIWSLDRGLAVTSMRTMDEVVSSTLGLPRLTSSLVGMFAMLALGLMAAGIYGLMAFTTALRLPELGVRLALGADRGQVLRMVVRQGLGPAILGVFVGLAAAAIFVRVVDDNIFGVPAVDPWTWIGVTALLMLSILAACWWPAYRASRVDPVSVLRAT